MQQAKLNLNSLMKQSQPFNLTVFTADTHGVEGHLNASCRAHGGKTFENIVRCSANQVAELVDYVEERGWSDKILVVVMGDHLAMTNAVSQRLNAASNRYVFSLIISKPKLIKNRDNIVHVDMYPTILKGLGFDFEGQTLALGISAVGSLEKALPQNREELLNKIANSYSMAYNQLWRENSTSLRELY